MLSSGDGIFDIQLAQHLATLERHPHRQGANKLRSRVDDGLDVATYETSYEPLTELSWSSDHEGRAC